MKPMNDVLWSEAVDAEEGHATDWKLPDTADMDVQCTIDADVGAIGSCSAGGLLQPELTIFEPPDCMANMHECTTSDDMLAGCISHVPCAQFTAAAAG